MSQITVRRCVVALSLLGLAVFTGCGDPNPNAPFDADTQQHSAAWLPLNHSVAAEKDLSSCRECHGENLSGGIANISCTTCHLGGATSAHPTDWVSTILTKHGPYVVANGSDSCKNKYCHGNTLSGVTDSGPACNACHSFTGLP